jgi:uncharacterized protein (TIGR03086 family)
MTPAERFRHHADRLDRLIAAVPTDGWDASSPCEGWTALDVVRHIVDTELDLLGRMGFEPPSIEGLEPLDAWPVVRAAVSRSLDDPARADFRYDGYFGPTTFGETVDQFYSFDLVLHRWDIARAVGLGDHEAIEPHEIDRIRADAAGFGAAMRMPGVIGAEVEAPADATEQERLLAWLGRDPRA